MNSLANFKNRRASRGQAYIETAAMIPFIIIFIAAIPEYSQMIFFHQRSSDLSREITKIAFRECAEVSNPETCMRDNVLTPMAREANRILPDFNAGDNSKGAMILTLYRRNSSGGIERLAPQRIGNPAFVSNFGAISGRFQALAERHEIIVFGEVFYSYPAGFFQNFMKEFLGFGTFTTQIYEATIF